MDIAALRQRHAQERYLRDWLDRGLPTKDVELHLSGKSTETEAVAATRSLCASEHCILILAGVPGSGKTSAASLWLMRETQQRAPVPTTCARFLHIAELVRIERHAPSAMEPIERASKLVLDDLGTESLDRVGRILGLLDSLLDFRYRHRLPLVVTTNLRATSFQKRYGDRVLDRIREIGVYVELGAQSLRGDQRPPESR